MTQILETIKVLSEALMLVPTSERELSDKLVKQINKEIDKLS